MNIRIVNLFVLLIIISIVNGGPEAKIVDQPGYKEQWVNEHEHGHHGHGRHYNKHSKAIIEDLNKEIIKLNNSNNQKDEEIRSLKSELSDYNPKYVMTGGDSSSIFLLNGKFQISESKSFNKEDQAGGLIVPLSNGRFLSTSQNGKYLFHWGSNLKNNSKHLKSKLGISGGIKLLERMTINDGEYVGIATESEILVYDPEAHKLASRIRSNGEVRSIINLPGNKIGVGLGIIEGKEATFRIYTYTNKGAWELEEQKRAQPEGILSMIGNQEGEIITFSHSKLCFWAKNSYKGEGCYGGSPKHEKLEHIIQLSDGRYLTSTTQGELLLWTITHVTSKKVREPDHRIALEMLHEGNSVIYMKEDPILRGRVLVGFSGGEYIYRLNMNEELPFVGKKFKIMQIKQFTHIL